MNQSSAVSVVRQACEVRFHALVTARPVIVLVREGRKVVRRGDRTAEVESGRLTTLPASVSLTIENVLSAGGRYVAHALMPGEDVLADLVAGRLPVGEPLGKTADDRAVTAFERAVVAVDDPLTPARLRDHVVREVLLWLAEGGLGFGPVAAPTMAVRLRAVIGADPAAAWRAAQAARALAVSEATLRRRLAADGTTFGDVLADVRMTEALGLLQTTDLPVNRIALDVGYASPSRFALRFRARFGIRPSDIRGGGGAVERIGAENDRIGAAGASSRL